ITQDVFQTKFRFNNRKRVLSFRFFVPNGACAFPAFRGIIDRIMEIVLSRPMPSPLGKVPPQGAEEGGIVLDTQ
ncbi:MAG: hypothetical protein SOW84_05825, partial [Candidatus Faecousia sp.]|nr:hypothetical protein [Candidatus Faecousia sp.]